MPPDLNSLPPSHTMSTSPGHSRPSNMAPAQRRDTPSPRASSTSLAAAATMNAADLSRRSSASNRGTGSPRLGRAGERRRSQVAMNININDPSLPSPGELSSHDPRLSLGHSFSSNSPSSIGGTRTIADGDPHHQRAPSLGEIHQELEQEQEAQVNRMLQMIREQQHLLDQMRMQTGSSMANALPGGYASNTGAVLDDLTPASERSFNLSSTTSQSQAPSVPHRIPIQRSSSRSPALRAIDSAHQIGRPGSPSTQVSLLESATVRRNSNSLRDESTYYQAETASLTRENQMLRQRIRELERQVTELNGGATGIAPNASRSASSERRTQRERQFSIPAIPSPLIRGDQSDETAEKS